MWSSQVPQCRKPYGCEEYDRGALNEEQQRKLNQKKVDQRIENENYLRKHPEVKLLIQDFMKQCFLNKPQDVREFAAVYFTDAKLKETLQDELKTRDKEYELNKKIEKLRREKSSSSSSFAAEAEESSSSKNNY